MRPVLLGVGSDSRMARALERQLNRGFAARGYQGACFDHTSAAADLLRDLKEREAPVALVVADQNAPEMAGLDLLREARTLHPEVRTVLLCAHGDLITATDAVNVGLLDHFLIKPFDGERDLLPIVSDLLEGWQGARDRDAAGVRIVGERHSPRAHEIRRFLDRNGIHQTWLSPAGDAGAELLRELPEPERTKLPVAIFPDGVAIGDPTKLQLASELGLATKPVLDHYELAIVGGGPAGLAAAVYGSSEGLTTVLLEREAPGGQAAESSRIENYLGFHAGLSGAELSRRAIIQARRFGAEIVRPTEVTGIEPLPSEQLTVRFADGSTITSNGVLISTGASYRRLTAPGVSELVARGIQPRPAGACRETRLHHRRGELRRAGRTQLRRPRRPGDDADPRLLADQGHEQVPRRSDRGCAEHRGPYACGARGGPRIGPPQIDHAEAAGGACRRPRSGRCRFHLHRSGAAHGELPRTPPRGRAWISPDRPGPGPAPRGLAAAARPLPAGVSDPERHRRRGRAPRIDQASRLSGGRGLDGGAAHAPVPQDSLSRPPPRRRRSATHRYAFDGPRP